MNKLTLSARALGTAAAAVFAVFNASAQTSPDAASAAQARPTFSPDGTVHVPAFELPPSQLSSKEAQDFMKMRAHMAGRAPSSQGDIASVRGGLENMLSSQVAAMRKAYPADVQEGKIAGVPIRTITPQGKVFDQRRILINLHGGGFTMCADACAMLESLPIAVVGGFKVVTVDYRMAPEAKHPAALEDITLVYRELLKSHTSKNIGIYGCSAGGALTGEAASWLPAHGLPQPGAIGIFGAGAVRFGAGDSAYVAGYTDGSFAPPPKPGETATDMTRGYFSDFDMTDATISAALHPDVIAKFPPTLIITGTRAMDMSPAIYTNSQLLTAGVHSTLIVGEGMGHCFIYQSNLPEARDAYKVITGFFRDNLSGK